MQHESGSFLRPRLDVNPAGELSKLSQNAILLVDDDPDIRALTRTFLEHEGFRVYSSGDAARAAQVFRSAPRIDLLITDFYMPDRSGMELALELKELRATLPVLMISGVSMDRRQLDRLRAEAWSFLAKPFSLPELLGTVHEILKTNVSVDERPRARRPIV